MKQDPETLRLSPHPNNIAGFQIAGVVFCDHEISCFLKKKLVMQTRKIMYHRIAFFLVTFCIFLPDKKQKFGKWYLFRNFSTDESWKNWFTLSYVHRAGVKYGIYSYAWWWVYSIAEEQYQYKEKRIQWQKRKNQ